MKNSKNILSLIITLFNRIHCTVLSTTLKIDTKDVHQAARGVLSQVPDICTAVVFFDDTVPHFNINRLIQGLHRYGRLTLTLDLSQDAEDTSLEYGTHEKSEIIKIYLQNLYRQGRCYAFITWLDDLEVLYPNLTNPLSVHPGWRKQDYVLVLVYNNYNYKKITSLKIWQEIPNLVGVTRKDTKANRIGIFTVIPNYKNGHSITKELSVWSAKLKQFENKAIMFPNRFATLNGASLNVGVLWKSPYLIWGDTDNPFLDGLDWRLMQIAKKKLNFETKGFKIVQQSGTLLENGSWTGLMGKLINGEIDFAVGGLTISPLRLVYFDFCRTYHSESYTFISPLLTTNPSVWNVLTKPLSLDIWLVLIGSQLLTVLCMTFIANAEKQLCHIERYEDNYFTRLRFNVAFLFCAFCQKPFHYHPKSIPLRLIYTGVSASLIILGIVYGARMFSIILSKRPDISMDKLKDIIKISGLRIDVRNYDGYLNDYLKETRGDLWKHMHMIEYNETYNSVDRVVQGDGIFIDARSSFEFISKYIYGGAVGSKFHLSSEDIVTVRVGWPTRQNWPYKSEIDDIISRTVESGLTAYWMGKFKNGKFGWSDEAFILTAFKEYLTPKIKRKEDVDPTLNLQNKEIKLILDNVLGVGVLWAIGLGISFFVFLCEVVLGGATKVKSKANSWCKVRDRVEILNSKNLEAQKLFLKLQKKHQLSIVWTDFASVGILNYDERTLKMLRVK